MEILLPPSPGHYSINNERWRVATEITIQFFSCAKQDVVLRRTNESNAIITSKIIGSALRQFRRCR